jgi:trk system potassium uptake protein TrkA
MYIIVVGCGRYGAHLSNQLSLMGQSVVIIDRREESFAALSPDFSGFRVVGDASELSVLREAKIEKADCLLSMCNEDTLNLMVTQVARYVFGVPKVFARVYNPSYESIFLKFGIQIISPIQLAVDALLKTLKLEKESEGKDQ